MKLKAAALAVVLSLTTALPSAAEARFSAPAVRVAPTVRVAPAPRPVVTPKPTTRSSAAASRPSSSTASTTSSNAGFWATMAVILGLEAADEIEDALEEQDDE